jgi:hypothetical protein
MCYSMRCAYQDRSGGCKLDLTRRSPPNDAKCSDYEGEESDRDDMFQLLEDRDKEN